ncbi:MAG: PfkB family carbohydrate kinase [Spirosomataceae bacterium]
MNLNLKKIQHIGIPVTNLERSEAFYKSLGFENVMASGFDYQGGKGKVAMMKSGDIIVEIYQMPEPELAAIKQRNDGHVDHVAFDVDDIDATFELLQKAQFTILEPAPVFLPFWKHGCKYFNILGPDGERLEFNQILKEQLEEPAPVLSEPSVVPQLGVKGLVCFGEVLWDLLPSGALPGGAPMNVAIHLKNLGIPSVMVSRVGNDTLGDALSAFLSTKHCPTQYIQTDTEHPTGTVNVHLSAKKEATYEIVHPVAWDFISSSPEVLELVKNSKALVFGTLACRDEHSRATLFELLEHAAIKVYDVNLRPPHYTQELIEALLEKANVVKMNEDELAIIAQWYGFEADTDKQKLTALAHKFKLDTLIVTQGGDGAMVWDDNRFYKSQGYRVVVADTIGSGDSFLAGFLKNILEGKSANYALEYACALGALVASHHGANPPVVEEDILEMMRQGANELVLG